MIARGRRKLASTARTAATSASTIKAALDTAIGDDGLVTRLHHHGDKRRRLDQRHLTRGELLGADPDIDRLIGAPSLIAPGLQRTPRRLSRPQGRREQARRREQHHVVLRGLAQRLRELLVNRRSREDVSEDVAAGFGGGARDVERTIADDGDHRLSRGRDSRETLHQRRSCPPALRQSVPPRCRSAQARSGAACRDCVAGRTAGNPGPWPCRSPEAPSTPETTR